MMENDGTMQKVRKIFEASGKTLDEVGLDMGYDKDVARKAVWQFLRTSDPRLSMLRRFAKAMQISLEELISDKSDKKATKPK
jgi:hypothetical protein